MKTLLPILLLLTALLSRATQLGIVLTKQPVYLHDAEVESGIFFLDVPVVMYVSGESDALYAIATPFVPPATSAWKTPQDVNLASLYGITVSVLHEKPEITALTIDASKAKVPEGYPFTVTQVTDAISTCARLLQPDQPSRKLTITITPSPVPAKDEKPAPKQ